MAESTWDKEKAELLWREGLYRLSAALAGFGSGFLGQKEFWLTRRVSCQISTFSDYDGLPSARFVGRRAKSEPLVSLFTVNGGGYQLGTPGDPRSFRLLERLPSTRSMSRLLGRLDAVIDWLHRAGVAKRRREEYCAGLRPEGKRAKVAREALEARLVEIGLSKQPPSLISQPPSLISQVPSSFSPWQGSSLAGSSAVGPPRTFP